MAAEGLITVASHRSVEDTIARLKTALGAKGIKVFTRIDHAANAEAAGLALCPTYLLAFGDAKAGTPLMAARQTIGIDLPLKMLVWQDEAGTVRISYNDPAGLVQRHDLDAVQQPVVAAMARLLAELATAAGA